MVCETVILSEGSEGFYIRCMTKTNCKIRKRSNLVGEWFTVPLTSHILLSITSAGILNARQMVVMF